MSTLQTALFKATKNKSTLSPEAAAAVLKWQADPNRKMPVKVLTHGEAEKARGLKSEHRVVQMYRKAFPQATVVAETNKYVQTQEDIDCWIDSYPVSIKDQTKAWGRSGRLSFELEVFFQPAEAWQPGNATLCKADYYLFLLGNAVYRVPVKCIKNIAAQPHNYYIATLNQKTIDSQIEMGHCHTNAKNLLIPLQDLIDLGIAVKIIG